MQFTAKCQALIAHNGIAKALLTVNSHPYEATEHLLCNLLKSRGNLEQGKTYRITIEEEGD